MGLHVIDITKCYYKSPFRCRSVTSTISAQKLTNLNSMRLQMDGLTRSEELVFVLAATNLPWELDAAMLRRLEKRVSFTLLDLCLTNMI